MAKKDKSMMTWEEKHSFLSKSTVRAGILAALFGYAFCNIIGTILGSVFSIGSSIATAAATGVKPTDVDQAAVSAVTGFCAALAGIILLWFHKRYHRPEYKGSTRKGFFEAKDILYLFIAFCVIDFGLALIPVFKGPCSLKIASVGTALMAGIVEEASMRVLPISVMMRTRLEEKTVTTSIIVSAVFFGLIHASNAAMGAPILTTAVQVIYAAGMGVFFGALYIRTGNILPVMAVHFMHDFISFIPDGLTTDSGIMTGLSVGGIIENLLMGAAFLAVGIYLIRKPVRADIVNVWRERWSMDTTATVESAE